MYFVFYQDFLSFQWQPYLLQSREFFWTDQLNVVNRVVELNLSLSVEKEVPAHMVPKVLALAPSAVQVGHVIAAIDVDAAGERIFKVFAQVISVASSYLRLFELPRMEGFLFGSTLRRFLTLVFSLYMGMVSSGRSGIRVLVLVHFSPFIITMTWQY